MLFRSPNANEEFVTGQKYEIVVCESMMDAVHGGGYSITEIFIPSEKLIFNHEGVFAADAPRNVNRDRPLDEASEVTRPLVEVQLHKAYIAKLVEMKNLQVKLENEKTLFQASEEYKNLFPKQYEALERRRHYEQKRQKK